MQPSISQYTVTDPTPEKVKEAPVIIFKPKPRIVRKTVRELTLERLEKEIQSNKKTLLMGEVGYDKARKVKKEQLKSNQDNLYDNRARKWFY